ncbi:MAG: hypothetical protein AAF357_17455, partial [Verrucomicrobiota bacterium]
VMKKPWRIGVALLWVVLPLHAEPRKFTNTEGKEIVAELVRVEGDEAVLKLANLKVANVPIASLSKEDQAYVKTWWEENKDRLGPMDTRLVIDKNTERIDRQTSRSGGGGKGNDRTAPVVKKMRKDEVNYECTLNSYVKKDVSDIEVEYTVYKRVILRDEEGTEIELEEIVGTEKIRLLEAHGSASFSTDVVPVENSSQKGGKGPDTMRSETIEGFVITLSAGGREFLKQSFPENYIQRLDEEEKREEER